MKRILALIIAIVMLVSAAGCGNQTGNSETTNPAASAVEVKEYIPYAVVGESYNLLQVIQQEEDAEYEFEATYIDPDSGEEKELVVKRNKITPKVNANISVTVIEEVSGATASFTIPIYITSDAIDNLIVSDGFASDADDGVVKTLTSDTNYLKQEGSTSAVEVTFNNAAEGGTALVKLSHYALTGYYSARVWDNAAVTFWVYNPMDDDIEFRLTGYDPVSIRHFEWKDADTQVAAPGQWTQIHFSLYKMGIQQVLFNDPNAPREDELILCARYAGSDACSMIIDGLDIVPAKQIEGLETGYVKPEPPAGDFSDLLEICLLKSQEAKATLSESDFGNNSRTSYCFGAKESLGYPTFDVDFLHEMDISGFDYLKFDVYAEKCYPWVSVAVRYIDENGEVQRHGTSYDLKREQWTTLYLNLDYLTNADLTRVVGFSFSINVADKMVKDAFNCVYFDNVCLYEHENSQPVIPAATVEDHDLISGPMYASNIKPGFSGVCKVAADETGDVKSNSTLLFWANNACGYPNVVSTFMFEGEQDWSDCSVLSFDSHQYTGHYWMCFRIITLDDAGNQKTLSWYHDTVLTHWMTNSAPLSWFKTEDGATASAEDLERVIGLSISVDLAVNVTSEVAHIFFDNVYVS